MTGDLYPNSADDRQRALKALDHMQPDLTEMPFYQQLSRVDWGVLREVLIVAACPVVCQGIVTEDNDWHLRCIRRAETSLKALRGLRIHLDED